MRMRIELSGAPNANRSGNQARRAHLFVLHTSNSGKYAESDIEFSVGFSVGFFLILRRSGQLGIEDTKRFLGGTFDRQRAELHIRAHVLDVVLIRRCALLKLMRTAGTPKDACQAGCLPASQWSPLASRRRRMTAQWRARRGNHNSNWCPFSKSDKVRAIFPPFYIGNPL